MSINEIIQQYVAPYIPTLFAVICAVVTFVKNNLTCKSVITKVSNKVESMKQDKLLEEVIEQNKIICQDNAALRKQISELTQELTRVKANEKK